MKKNLLYLSLAFVSIGFFTCEDSNDGPFFKLNSAQNLTAPAEGLSYVLIEDEKENNFETFEWTAMDFSPSNLQNPFYRVQVDYAGNDFSIPSTIASTSDLSATPKIGELNTILLDRIGFLAGEDTTLNLEVRIKAGIENTDIDDIFSNIIGMAVTIYKPATGPAVALLNVPGAHQGWDPENDDNTIFSRMDDEIYEGYAFFPEDNNEFKYAKGSWAADSNWGDDDADGILDPDGGNIVADLAGMYRLNVDLNDGVLTHEFTRTDWGLIGPVHAGGWDNDEDMEFDPVTGNLTITIDLLAGEFKFRANDDWTINFGDNDADGSLEQDGANIMLTEDGNYTIELIVNDPVQYTYSVTKN